jgi:hypothetical protein
MTQHNQNPRRLKRFLDGINPAPLNVEIPYDTRIDLPKVEVQTPLPDRGELRDQIHRLGCQALTESRNLGFAEARGDFSRTAGKKKRKDLLDIIEEHEQVLMQLIQAHDKALLSQLREGAPKKKHHTESDRNIAYREGFNDARTLFLALFDKLESGL